ncbi:hypothetical protein BH23ACT5_BH23ACT5_15910 [soil metagenome]
MTAHPSVQVLTHDLHHRRTQQFSANIRFEGASAMVAVTGELDLATAPRLELNLGWCRRTSSSIVLDLSDITFIDLAGLKPILASIHSGHPTSIRSTSKVVRRLLFLIDLESVLPDDR